MGSKKHVLAWVLLGGLLTVLSAICYGEPGNMNAMDEAQQWATAKLLGKPTGVYTADPSFAFRYNGKPSRDLLPTWRVHRASRKLDAQRTEHSITYNDPATGLEVRCIAVQYQDFPTVEWTLTFRNISTSDTPILSDIQALDTEFRRGTGKEFVLHHQTGALATPSDYEPHETTLAPNAEQHLATTGGRPSNSVLPYFNLEFGDGGAILVIGWPGQWAAQYTRDASDGLRVYAGQETTHFRLHPGEEVRSPRIVVQFWKGDRLDSQNVWRRWMLAHNLPRPGGKALVPLLNACSSHQFGEMIHANEENQKLFIDRYLAEGFKLDYWWMDAGWYKNNGTWANTGTWEVDPQRFPHGLRAITDHAHAKGVKSIVWFEPERVTSGTWLWENHPEWLLSPPADPGNPSQDVHQKLLNLGDPAALQWLTDHVDHLLTEQGIDLYRQDFNMDPLAYWRAHDAEDRQGITEIRYVEGYLAYWDVLRSRHPNLLIDSCASGGRRNDIETLRRAVPLLRSDYLFEPVGQQDHTYGISFWIPFSGTGTLVGDSAIGARSTQQVDPYSFRSEMGPSMTACWDVRRTDLDYAALRRLIEQLRTAQPFFLHDYYPLTPYSQEQGVWVAWQFDWPEQGAGMVQAFRRADCSIESTHFQLRGLQPDARYRLTNVDHPGSQEKTGRELMEDGLPISIAQQPGAAILLYQRIAN